MRPSLLAQEARLLIAASLLAGSVVSGAAAFGNEVEAGPPIEDVQDEVGESRAQGGD